MVLFCDTEILCIVCHLLCAESAAYRVTAKFNFHTRSERELPFRKGDPLTVLNRVNSDWLQAVDRNGQGGLIPDAYVIPVRADSSVVDFFKLQLFCIVLLQLSLSPTSSPPQLADLPAAQRKGALPSSDQEEQQEQSVSELPEVKQFDEAVIEDSCNQDCPNLWEDVENDRLCCIPEDPQDVESFDQSVERRQSQDSDSELKDIDLALHEVSLIALLYCQIFFTCQLNSGCLVAKHLHHFVELLWRR